MQTEPLEFRSTVVNKRGKSLARTSQYVGSALGQVAAGLSADMLDEAFAVYSRIDAGTTSADQLSEPSALHRPKNAQLAARELVASISVQLAAIDRQRRQLEDLLDAAEVSAS